MMLLYVASVPMALPIAESDSSQNRRDIWTKGVRARMRITIWNEYRHEREQDEVRAVYPQGIHVVLEEALREGMTRSDVALGTATLDEPEHGLPPEVLDATDVLFWWGHGAHAQVRDQIADR